ncbi:DUF4870 domain-containing protein [Cellulomonas sp.]|uniref:DUF4870 domain-containing protein n=1 Tax=Cellulomonas sp. TaxID=40001 RepID=UPI001B061480|nr:DUF4870 domain-containing protein [Cellulomonas sp.]MBO9555207.1 DUF4870 domain-containing protein [Cellulomonas sp.]
MSNEYPPVHRPSEATDQRTWAMVAHLGGILAYFWVGWVAALVVWLVYRERGGVAAENGRVALNFQITVLIGLVACRIVQALPGIGIIGWIAFIALSIISLVLSILAALAVQRGGSYRYPFSLELVR